MTTHLHTSSDKNNSKNLDAKAFSFGVIVADWNNEITDALKNGAIETLKKSGAKEENIVVRRVPGSIELTLGAQLLEESLKLDTYICLGCVIQGETKHFDYVCDSVTYGITELNIKYKKPFIFGVLTTNNFTQAKDRAGGKYGNKGDEAAISAIRMAHLRKNLLHQNSK
ncbi:MAG: 6,7-dimethyl-8-ribityllumazine synthase [Bacteroidales bacterium]